MFKLSEAEEMMILVYTESTQVGLMIYPEIKLVNCIN